MLHTELKANKEKHIKALIQTAALRNCMATGRPAHSCPVLTDVAPAHSAFSCGCLHNPLSLTKL